MERPERKIFPIYQIGNQIREDARYQKALKEYEKWIELENERKRLENEAIRLQNEEKRALVEAMRKQQNIGGVENMYDRVKPEEKKSFWQKLWES
jgi:antitoxin component HigA of HigAB toxin-antitoxin module